MLVTIVLAALAVDGLFSLAGIIPDGPRPTRADIFGTISIDYKLFLKRRRHRDLRLGWSGSAGRRRFARLRGPLWVLRYSDREHSSRIGIARRHVPTGDAPPTASPQSHAGASSVSYEDATKRYEGSDEPAVDGLTLDVPAGEICVLVGPSAAARRRRCGWSTAPSR